MSKILKMKDNAENYRVDKGMAFNLPMRLLIVGKSEYSGKTNHLGNLMLRPYDKSDIDGKDFYHNDFKPEDIYVVCPSIRKDAKWQRMIEMKSIPEDNVMDSYDEGKLTDLYHKIESEHLDRMERGEPPVHTLIIMDDCSYAGDLKSKVAGIISRFACNARHEFISIIVTAQKYTQIPTTLRENATGMIFYSCTNPQLDKIYEDIGKCTKRKFIDAFRKVTDVKYQPMIVNYSNGREALYLDGNYEPIDI